MDSSFRCSVSCFTLTQHGQAWTHFFPLPLPIMYFFHPCGLQQCTFLHKLEISKSPWSFTFPSCPSKKKLSRLTTLNHDFNTSCLPQLCFCSTGATFPASGPLSFTHHLYAPARAFSSHSLTMMLPCLSLVSFLHPRSHPLSLFSNIFRTNIWSPKAVIQRLP